MNKEHITIDKELTLARRLDAHIKMKNEKVKQAEQTRKRALENLRNILNHLN